MKYETQKNVHPLEEININQSAQWVLVRGKNTDAPLFIHVQQGPGFPMISEANEMEKFCTWKIISWSLIGISGVVANHSAKTYVPETINLAQMADDIIACTKYLLKKYNKSKAVIVGYSIGATTA